MCRRNRPSLSLRILVFTLTILLSSPFIYAKELPSPNISSKESPSKESMPKEPIVVDGDRVEYFQDQKKAVGTGNVSIKFKDMVLTCDKITVYLDTREAIAEGNVKITQKDSFFTGDRVNYNFETRQAKVIDGYVSSKPFYGKAQEADKVAGKDEYKLERGYITTCDLDKPHYRIQAKHVELYLNDKVVAKHIFLFIGNTPVFYLPYYVQPLNEKKSHFTVTAGNRDEWGYYVLTACRLHFSDQNRADLLLDYRGKRGFGYGINDYYDSEVGKGAVKYYYTHDYADYLKGAYERGGDMRPRYRWQWRHKWDMPETTGTTAIIEFNKLHDPDVIKDFFYNEYEELGANPDNYLSVVTAKPDYTTQLLVRKNFNDFYDVIERLPEFDINIPQYNLIKDMPLYYTGSANAVYLNHVFDNSNTSVASQKDIGVGRVDIYNRLSYALRLFKALNITPFAGTRQTYYSRNKWGDTNEIRGIFDAGADASIKFYKIYDVESNFLGLDLHKLRHIITPTASYYYAHQPTIDVNNLNQFDSIDALNTENYAKFALENRFQTKRSINGNLQSVDLATFLISTDYLFRMKKSNLAIKDHTQKFQNVQMQLELIPYSWMSAVAKMTVNPKNCAIATDSLDFVANIGDKWNVDVGYRYNKSLDFDIANQLTSQIIYKINEKWKLRFYSRYNLDKSFEEQEYTIYRDLHCIRAEMTYREAKNPHEVSLWFTFVIKAFPQYPIGYRRTYSQPEFGSSLSSVNDRIGKGNTVAY